MCNVLRKSLPVLILLALLITLMGAAVPAQAFSTTPMVAAGYGHTVGLKADGTVVAVGDNDYDQCNVDGWTGIIQVAAGAYHTVGLKADGTVVAVGNNRSGQCNVGSWTDIIQVAAGYGHTVGLKADGTVVAVGHNDYDQCNLVSWALGVFMPDGSQRWNLNSNLIMKKNGAQSGFVEFGIAEGLEHIWLSDQAAQTDVTFPAGDWLIHLVTEDWDSECQAQIGESDGTTFNPFNTVPAMGSQNGNIITFTINTGGTVPQGNYLALKIFTADGSRIITEGNSYLKSPSSDPGYPLPELAAGILLGLGLAGLGAYLALRRRSARGLGLKTV
ncbi:MAG TPA: hypothetical protein VLH15_00925 [Dehalococcoidales bacterium]|nr:hypothetical protein [Dehalococcoidales bacterium]